MDLRKRYKKEGRNQGSETELTSPGVPKLTGRCFWAPITAITATNETINAANN